MTNLALPNPGAGLPPELLRLAPWPRRHDPRAHSERRLSDPERIGRDCHVQPAITLNNGVELPALGFGVFQTPPEVTQAAVEEALRIGYRMVDTAASYGNEREVGAAIAASGIPRSELFVQTKLWVSDYGYDAALHGFDVSTRKLGLDTVDLYLLHQPLPQAFDETVGAYRPPSACSPRAGPGPSACPTSARRTSRRSCRGSTSCPAVNQVEVHPYYNQPALRAEHARLGIATQAWSPLGGVIVYRPRTATRRRAPWPTRSSPAIAERHGKTPAQVVLRWHIDSGRSAIPKSVRPERIAENLDVFGFSLSARRDRGDRRPRHGRAGRAEPGRARLPDVQPADPGGVTHADTHPRAGTHRLGHRPRVHGRGPSRARDPNHSRLAIHGSSRHFTRTMSPGCRNPGQRRRGRGARRERS